MQWTNGVPRRRESNNKENGPPAERIAANQNQYMRESAKRLSFSTSDLDDPNQLNTLYDQCRTQVLNGTHPVSRDTAIRLAAVQCYIEHGRYRSGVESFIKSLNLLPKEYARAKEHEKNIVQEYKELMVEGETAAKKRYCELCRALPTYGVTFFIVKERQAPGERRLVPRLFGVSKDCVMCVDRKTKTVLKSWPLEQLRRWAASPTTFNIDFGDYTDGYYSIQTLEGETIKKLIAEYVDIILKKSQFVDPRGIEGDEGGIMLEDHISGGKALPFMVENGRITWRQKRETMGLSGESSSGGEFMPISENLTSATTMSNGLEGFEAVPPPVSNLNEENSFIPILDATNAENAHIQLPLEQQRQFHDGTQSNNVHTVIRTEVHPTQYQSGFVQYQPLNMDNWGIASVPQQQQQQHQHEPPTTIALQPFARTTAFVPLQLHQQTDVNGSSTRNVVVSQEEHITSSNAAPIAPQTGSAGDEYNITQKHTTTVTRSIPIAMKVEQNVPLNASNVNQKNMAPFQQPDVYHQQQRFVHHVPMTVEYSGGQQQQTAQQQQKYFMQQPLVPPFNQQQQQPQATPFNQQQQQPQATPFNQQQQQYLFQQQHYNTGVPSPPTALTTTAQSSHFDDRNTVTNTIVTTTTQAGISPIKQQQLSVSQQQAQTAVAESPDAAIETCVHTAEEARLWLTPDSLAGIRDMPEIMASGPDADGQLNWLIAIGTHAVSQHLGTLVVVTAQVIESTSPWASTTQKVSPNFVTRTIISAGVVLADLVACVRELCALLWNVSESVAIKLLHKTHKLCSVFAVFVQKLHSQSGAKRAAVLSAASLVGETVCALMSTTSHDDADGNGTDDNKQQFYDALNEKIQNVASGTANLVLQAKVFPTSQQNRLFQCATQIAFTASELIALTRVLVAVLSSHANSKQRVAEAVQRVSNTINSLVNEAGGQFNAQSPLTNDHGKKYDQLLSTANFANNALHQFLYQIQN